METTVRRSPQLPAIARIPLAWIPSPIKAKGIVRMLNGVFAAPLAEGELDFLSQRTVNVIISDAAIRFSLTLDAGRFVATGPAADADLRIEGTTHTLLLLASRSEDADTLFFNRLLKTSGDTELGLYVKNFLAGIEPDSLPGHRFVDPVLRRVLAIADWVEGRRHRSQDQEY